MIITVLKNIYCKFFHNKMHIINFHLLGPSIRFITVRLKYEKLILWKYIHIALVYMLDKQIYFKQSAGEWFSLVLDLAVVEFN